MTRRWPFVRRPRHPEWVRSHKKGDPKTKMRRKTDVYEVLSILPLAAFLLGNPRIRKHHPMSLWKRLRLVWLFYDNSRMIRTGTPFRAHVAMAAKLLEIPPEVEGVVVECGCWKGGATANLSLVCEIAGRDLIVYDSFAGLPEPEPGDKYADDKGTGIFKGELEEVRENVRRYGAIDRCEFRKGWFADTMADHTEPIVLTFLDVDYQASLHDCVQGLWPYLTDQGYLFLDEYSRLDYCGLFYSETYWERYFDQDPPGIMGTGTGVGVGQYLLGPLSERTPLERPGGLAFTRRDFNGRWDYFPDEA